MWIPGKVVLLPKIASSAKVRFRLCCVSQPASSVEPKSTRPHRAPLLLEAGREGQDNGE